MACCAKPWPGYSCRCPFCYVLVSCLWGRSWHSRTLKLLLKGFYLNAILSLSVQSLIPQSNHSRCLRLLFSVLCLCEALFHLFLYNTLGMQKTSPKFFVWWPSAYTSFCCSCMSTAMPREPLVDQTHASQPFKLVDGGEAQSNCPTGSCMQPPHAGHTMFSLVTGNHFCFLKLVIPADANLGETRKPLPRPLLTGSALRPGGRGTAGRSRGLHVGATKDRRTQMCRGRHPESACNRLCYLCGAYTVM